jgi:hypothetical protein
MLRLSCKPLVTIRSPLGEIDRRWLEFVEPYLYRPPKGHEAYGCWLWQGPVDGRTGEPFRNLYDPTKKRPEKGWRKMQFVKFLIAEIFVIGWCDGYSAFHECGNNNCLAPHHLLFTRSHHTQFNLAALVKKKRVMLKDYRNEVLREDAERALHAASEGDTK